jgi:signal transduction histidine kinase
VLASSGLSATDVGGKNRWVSKGQLETFLERARERLGSDDEFRAACVHRLAEGYGPMRWVLRAMAPSAVLALAVQTYELVSRVDRAEVVSSSSTEMHVRFVTDRPLTRLNCLCRQAQTEALPTLWRLPPATLVETSCTARGDAACEYQLRYFTRSGALPVLLGALAGGALAAASAVAGLLGGAALLPLAAVGAAVGLTVAQRRSGRANLRAAERQSQALRAVAEEEAEARRELARQERARAFGTIAATLAHDLKHPLSALEAVLMREGVWPRPEVDQALLDAARREVPRLAAIDEGLRDLGRAEQPRVVEVPVASLVQAAASYRLPAEARGVTLEIEAADAEARIHGDPWQLARAVQNLVSNALDATPRGGRVGVAIRVTASEVEIVVEDNGRGVPLDERDDLFEAFRKGRGSSGMGLGLYVVQRIVEVHRGRVALASSPEAGTRATITIPGRDARVGG